MPGIYTKLLDVDKVDLVLSAYATNDDRAGDAGRHAQGQDVHQPVRARRKRRVPLSEIFLGAADRARTPGLVHRRLLRDRGGSKIRNRRRWRSSTADAEFSQNACEGARENAKKHGFKIVYDKTYPPPPKTTDFAPIVRAIKAANADLVVVCSYPLDSVGMVLAANEVGLTPKMFGGALVGLQATVFKEKLKGKLNGIVNYETWVPDAKEMYHGTEAFFKEYQSRAKVEGVDPLGYYLGGWGYAYIQILGDAVKGANSINDDKIADYLRTHTFDTVMGSIKFGAKGEWAFSRMLTVQYHDIKDDANLETWRGMSYQTVLAPEDLETGKIIYPYEKAHK